MSIENVNLATVLTELEDQGLAVTIHNVANNTWFIKGDGIYVGYVATGDELIALKNENRLSIHGIRSLG